MAGMKLWRDAERLFSLLRIEIVDCRQGTGSHRVYTLGYRGFRKTMTVPKSSTSKSSQKNRIAELERFRRLVDETLAGGSPELPVGVWRV